MQDPLLRNHVRGKAVGPLLRARKVGPSHQLINVFTAVTLSKMLGLTYAHAPFTGTHREELEGISQWEYFFQLGRGEASLLYKLTHTFRGKPIPHVAVGFQGRFVEPPGACKTFLVNDETVFAGKPALDIFLEAAKHIPPRGVMVIHDPARYADPWMLHELARDGHVPADLPRETQEWFVRKYRQSHVIRQGADAHWRDGSYFAPDEMAIAFILRYGGSVDDLRRYRERTEKHGEGTQPRILPTEHNLRVLGLLKEAFPHGRIKVFSDTHLEHPRIAPIVAAGYDVHFNDFEFPDLFNVYHTLISCNVIYDGASGFGGMAAYMGGNVLLQNEVSAIRLPGRVLVDKDTGDFDVDELRKVVRNKYGRTFG